MYDACDMAIEFSRIEREAYANIAAKRASEQLGEAWVGLDDRRTTPNAMRGPDRRQHD
jgi:hypothetical protein